MSTIFHGTGSEWHMLRMLGRHRADFTRRVQAVIGDAPLEWLDFDYTGTLAKNYCDAEIKGLNFLRDNHAARTAWASWWPQSGNVQNWDAVGRRTVDGKEEWLLVEAKGNLQELKQSCGAKPASEGGGRDVIIENLQETQKSLDLPGDRDWTTPYYQFANRLALLYFLVEIHHVPARLLFVYFTGDDPENESQRNCPKSEEGWRPELDAMKQELGLTGESPLEKRVHQVFVPVQGVQ